MEIDVQLNDKQVKLFKELLRNEAEVKLKVYKDYVKVSRKVIKDFDGAKTIKAVENVLARNRKHFADGEWEFFKARAFYNEEGR